jgi:hypothetical protein
MLSLSLSLTRTRIHCIQPSLTMTMKFTTALVRAIPDSFTAALRATEPEQAIDVNRARLECQEQAAHASQHVQVIKLDADEAYPDCVFIEV